ncbi:hypothetical protein BGZ60DRAFT_531279 [Tricladium varicosporioides]|nr:hypothetical protein BGZ60DRAFT_531279 [Hymenoscyphus varicosporioides]
MIVNKVFKIILLFSVTSRIYCAPVDEQERRKIIGRVADPLPTNPIDPGIPGPYQATEPAEYTLPDVLLFGVANPVEMRAVVVGPKSASGLRPLVLFLHGRASNCYTPNLDDPNDHTQGTSSEEWPCPAGKLLFPSFRGYLKTQTLLATHGFVTVSISSNGINAQDTNSTNTALFQKVAARSALVRLHLSHWASWSVDERPQAPSAVQGVPPPNMARVMLVGHSKGGEGINRAAIDSLIPPVSDDPVIKTAPSWQIRGMLFIAPQAIGQNPVPNVPSVVVLPGCDGDLIDLEGQIYIDGLRGVDKGLALHSSLFVVNASHPYFNSEWPQISTHTPACDPTNPQNRLLTRAQQEATLASYASAASRLFLESDDTVRPLIDGSGFRAASASSAGSVTVVSHAIGANRVSFIDALETLQVNGAGGKLCDAIATPTSTTSCDLGQSPHQVQFQSVVPEKGRYMVQATWDQPSQIITVRRPYPTSIAGSESIAMRIIVKAATVGVRVEAFILDASGHRATLGTFALNGLPSTAPAGAPNWAQEVRLSLTGVTAAGVDLNQVYTLELVPQAPTSGGIWLLDAWGWRSGTPDPQIVTLPRLDLGDMTVKEGGTETTSYSYSIPITGSGTGQVRVFTIDPGTELATDAVVSVLPGMTSVEVPILSAGNNIPGDTRGYAIAAKAMQGVMVGDPVGSLTIQDDDA